jgi:formamidopyrimidine-DNA glycosylase
VGNIYANEALFRARINPRLPARRIGLARYEILVDKIRETLAEAIAAGGSSLRDYVNSAGEAGFFQNRFFVYGRGGDACLACTTPIRSLVLGQRATFYCPRCQR